MSDEESFVILGSSPTPSMEAYVDPPQRINYEPTLPEDNVTQSISQIMYNYSILDTDREEFHQAFKSLSLESQNEPVSTNATNPSVAFRGAEMQSSKASVESSNVFAEKFLLGEVPADTLKDSISKYFPSFSMSSLASQEKEKLQSLMTEHIKLKENLQKTNVAMQQHFDTINKWQNQVKDLKDQHSSATAEYMAEIGKLNEDLRLKNDECEKLQVALTERDEFNQTLKLEIAKIKEEQDEKTMQFNMNLGYASAENKDLVQEISNKDAIIQNMTILMEKLKQDASFELVSVRQNESPNSEKAPSSLSQAENELSACTSQLAAAREQNMQLMEEVTGNIATIKRLQSESQKLQHQLLSLEKIANENDKNSLENRETVDQLKGELSRVLAESMEIREMKSIYVQQIECLQQNLSTTEDQLKKATDELSQLQSQVTKQDQLINKINAELVEQKTHSHIMQQENVVLRSKGIRSDVEINQRQEEMASLKDENEFLKAQLDVYKADFEMERQARQDIANEREEILSDLKLLQRRNQQLIDEAQSRIRMESPSTSTHSSNGLRQQSNSRPAQGEPTSIGKFACPVCDKRSSNLNDLHAHIQICLEE